MVFEAAKLACANKTKELITSQKLGSHDFWQIAYSVLNKSKSAIPYKSALFPLFSVVDRSVWFWMESLHKNIQLMLEFLKAPFLVLQFYCYTLMTFLMMLYVILLSILMILLSILSVIRHLICGSNLNWLQSHL